MLVCSAGLEPQRKAYLMQNIMASKYIVAQQRRHVPGQGLREQVGSQGAVVYRSYNQPGVLGCQHYKRGYASSYSLLLVT